MALWSTKPNRPMLTALRDFQETDISLDIDKQHWEYWEEFLTEDQTTSTFLKKNPGENEDHWDAKQKITFNVADQVLRALSYVYVGKVLRRAGDPDNEQEPVDKLFQSIWKRNRMDFFMHQVCYWTRCFGRTAVELRWIAPSTVRYILRMPYQIDVLQNKDDPEAVDAVKICVNKQWIDETESKGHGHYVYRYHIWTRADEETVEFAITERDAASSEEDLEELEDGKRIKRLKLDDLPFVFPSSRLPIGLFWTHGIGEALYNQNKVLNKLNTELGHMMMFLHGQPVATNCEVHAVGPDSIVQIGNPSQMGGGEAPDNVSFDIVNPNTQLNVFVEALRELYEQLALSYSLPRDYFTKVQSSAESGVAIMAKRLALRDDRHEQEAIWRAVEDEIFRKTILLGQAHDDTKADEAINWGADGEDVPPIALGSIDPQTPFEIHFPQWKEQTTGQDRVLDEKHRLEIGVATPLDILRERHPELTQAQAQKRLQKAQEAKQERIQGMQGAARDGFLQDLKAKDAENPIAQLAAEREKREQEQAQEPKKLGREFGD